MASSRYCDKKREIDETGKKLSDAAPPPTPFTAARCMRHLRCIVSSIKAVRDAAKEHSRTTAQPSAAQIAPSRYVSRLEDEDDDSGDPDWAAQPQQGKANKRKYRGNANRQFKSRRLDESQPGQISAPTPLAVRRTQPSDSPAQGPRGSQFFGTPQPSRFLPFKHLHCTDLRRDSSPNLLNKVEKLFRDLAAILNLTAAPWETPQGPSGTGAPSLMSTCLRKMPAYIQGRQAWEDEEKIVGEKEDAMIQIYEELEAYGTTGETKGWKPLGELLRTHAVGLVAGAVADGLFDVAQVDALVHLCHKSRAPRAAETILSAFVFANGPLPLPNKPEEVLIETRKQPKEVKHPGISAAYAWAQWTGNWAFFYRELRWMLLTRVLPVEWLATETLSRRFWKAVLYNIARERVPTAGDSGPGSEVTNLSSVGAEQLFHTALALACGKTPESCEQLELFQESDYQQRVSAGMQAALDNFAFSLPVRLAKMILDPDTNAVWDKHTMHTAIDSIACDLANEVFESSLDEISPRFKSAVPRLSTIICCAVIVGVLNPEHYASSTVSPIPMYIRALEQIERSPPEQLQNSPRVNLPLVVYKIVGTWDCHDESRPENSPAFRWLKMVVEALKSFEVSPAHDGAKPCTQLDTLSWFLKLLARDSAIEFARWRNYPVYIQYAMDLECAIQPPGSSSRPSFRYEETIEEWIAATPHGNGAVNRENASIPPHSCSLVSSPMQLDGSRNNLQMDDFDALPSSPIKATTPAQPRFSMSKLLLGDTTPDVLAPTPALSRNNCFMWTGRSRPLTRGIQSSFHARLSSVSSSSRDDRGARDSGIGMDQDSPSDMTASAAEDNDTSFTDYNVDDDEDELSFAMDGASSPRKQQPRMTGLPVKAQPTAQPAQQQRKSTTKGKARRKQSLSIADMEYTQSFAKEVVTSVVKKEFKRSSNLAKARKNMASSSSSRQPAHTTMTLSAVFGLEGPDDSEDELLG